MDPAQKEQRNPYGMDESCTNCPDLVEPRTQVVHGYGDASAEFLFVGERPSTGADESGIPFYGREEDEAFQEVLRALGFAHQERDEEPDLENVYLTNLTRCRDPERPPAVAEIDTCEPFLIAEIRMINPEILVPVGERALAELAEEYTTTPASEIDLATDHATEIRGRGFEIVPMIHPAEASDDEVQAFLEAFSNLLGRDYRQTKGRRGR